MLQPVLKPFICGLQAPPTATPATAANAASALHAVAAQELGLTPVQHDNLRKMIRLAPDGCPHSSLATLAKKMSEPMNQDALRRFKEYITNWMGMQQPETVQQLQQQQQLQHQQQLDHQQQLLLQPETVQQQQQLQHQQHFDRQRQMLLQQQVLRYQTQRQHAEMHQHTQDKLQAGKQQQQSAQDLATDTGGKLAGGESGLQQQPHQQEAESGKLAMARHAQVDCCLCPERRHLHVTSVSHILVLGQTSAYCIQWHEHVAQS